MSEIHTLLFIGFIAVLAPLVVRLPIHVRTPVVVLELVLGILIGPGGAAWVTSEGAIGFLGEFGLIFLFFQAGFEFNQDKIGGAPLRLGALAWLGSLGLTSIFVGLLYIVGLLRAPLLVGLLLPTTALGILIPILRESDELDSDFGRYVVGVAIAGELGPIILASIVLAHANHHLHQTLLTIAFLAFALGLVVLAKKLRSKTLSLLIAQWMGEASVLPVRIAILILLGLISLASELGMEIVLGAYAAGMAIGMLVRGTKAAILEDRLTSIGSGFFIPLFFITSGIEFDLPSLLTSPASLARFILFSGAFLFVHGIPILLYRSVLPERDLLPLALLSATTLPLVVAITYLGRRTGQMLPENAAALVGAAVMSVAVYPALAVAIRSKSETTGSVGATVRAAHPVVDLVLVQLPRFIALISQRSWRRR